jgi:hypothetical protein
VDERTGLDERFFFTGSANARTSRLKRASGCPHPHSISRTHVGARSIQTSPAPPNPHTETAHAPSTPPTRMPTAACGPHENTLATFVFKHNIYLLLGRIESWCRASRAYHQHVGGALAAAMCREISTLANACRRWREVRRTWT